MSSAGRMITAALIGAAVMSGTAHADASSRLHGLDPDRVGQQRSTIPEPAGGQRGLRSPEEIGSQIPSDSWGGQTVSSSGEVVSIFLSSSYEQTPENQALATTWADFLSGILHGPELTEVDVFVAPPREVTIGCGNGALACYLPLVREILLPGEPPEDGSATLEDVLIHEYGHHVANSRRNPPLPGIFGPKRWATKAGVCPGLNSGRIDPFTYRKDPAEGFAEAYRVANGGRWSGLVKRKLFYPGPRTRRIIERDVTDPWDGNVTRTQRLKPTRALRRGKVHFTRGVIKTPLDGVLKLSYRRPRKSGLFVFLFTGDELADLESLFSERREGRTVTTRVTICGSRKVHVEAITKRALNKVKLTVEKPV